MVMYQNANIFSKEGIAKFLEDTSRVEDHLMPQAFGVEPYDVRDETEDH
jgi:hypothetical protein